MTMPLAGRHIFVVEDEVLVAMALELALREAGCTVEGPITTLAEAMLPAAQVDADAAVLDLNLGGQRVYPVATLLAQRNVPFIFLTGYDADELPPEFADRPHLKKPFTMERVLDMLESLLQDPPT